MRERRRHCRIPQDAAIDVTWTELGETKTSHARYVDISVGGLRVESPIEIPRDTEVMLRADHIDFTGTALVRHVVSSGTKFILGLQLSERTIEEIFGFSSDFEAV
jgi:hypothetical protein